MRKRTGIILLVSFILIILGLILALVGFLAFGGSSVVAIGKDGIRIPKTVEPDTFKTEIPAFSSLVINSASPRISVVEGDSFSLEFDSERRYAKKDEAGRYSLEDFGRIENGTLIIDRNNDTDSPGEIYFGIGFSGIVAGHGNGEQAMSEQLKLTVPRGTVLEGIKVSQGFGVHNDIMLKNVSAKELSASEHFSTLEIEGGTFGRIALDNMGQVSLSDGVKTDELLFIQSDEGSLWVRDSLVKKLEISGYGGNLDFKGVQVIEPATIKWEHGNIYMAEAHFEQGLDVVSNSGPVYLHGEFMGTVSIQAGSETDVVILSVLPSNFDITSSGPVYFDQDTLQKPNSFKREADGAVATFVVKARTGRVFVKTEAPAIYPLEEDDWQFNDISLWGDWWADAFNEVE